MIIVCGIFLIPSLFGVQNENYGSHKSDYRNHNTLPEIWVMKLYNRFALVDKCQVIFCVGTVVGVEYIMPCKGGANVVILRNNLNSVVAVINLQRDYFALRQLVGVYLVCMRQKRTNSRVLCKGIVIAKVQTYYNDIVVFNGSEEWQILLEIVNRSPNLIKTVYVNRKPVGMSGWEQVAVKVAVDCVKLG